MVKIKYLKILGLTIGCLLLRCTVNAFDFESGGIYYNITSSTAPFTVEVTYGVRTGSYSGVIDIPSMVSYNNQDYSVTSIGVAAFAMCNNLTLITIPMSITRIEKNAFSNDISLTTIIIPNSVKTIGEK
ncbi:MAG: leucine-rich repeat protein, partial [Bacteroidales bacterium]|nr:leucine-rich repeat protein [Bacteroidales bacterium]